MLNKKKEKSGKIPSTREKTGFLEPTGTDSHSRFNPKSMGKGNPSARTKPGFLEETGTEDHKRFK
jgi:hypothetical protein